MQTTPIGNRRIAAIDLGRGLALAAMAIYHFTWDLEFFGYAEAGMTAQGGWRLFARAIATSFLFLVGVSLYLAHARGVAARPFLKRFALVAGAAAIISVATYMAMPGAFIFFGILHHIALASVLGLAFLRLGAPLVILAAIAVALAPLFLRSEFFDHPALWWVGLSATIPRSNDYVPLFPWFATVLAGIAAADIAQRTGLIERLRQLSPGRWSNPLQLAGRHSLIVYLVHQPVLIGAIWLATLVSPPPPQDPEIGFNRSCQAQCAAMRDADFCALYCVCMLDTLVAENRFDEVATGRLSAETTSRLQEIVSQCSFEAEFGDWAEEPG